MTDLLFRVYMLGPWDAGSHQQTAADEEPDWGVDFTKMDGFYKHTVIHDVTPAAGCGEGV